MKSWLAGRGALASACSAREPIARRVLAEDVEDRVGVRGRFHAAHIHLLELLHVGEHLRELRLELGDFLLAQMQARKLRGVADIEGGTHRDGQ